MCNPSHRKQDRKIYLKQWLKGFILNRFRPALGWPVSAPCKGDLGAARDQKMKSSELRSFILTFSSVSV